VSHLTSIPSAQHGIKPAAASTKTNLPARVLVVDDHPIVRQGYVQLISSVPGYEVCGEAADSNGALNLARTKRPNLAIVDIALKGSNGLEVIKSLKALDPDLKMLAASALDESLFAERALRAGALGFISKQEVVENLLDAVRRVLHGEIYLSPRMTQRLLHTVSGQPHAQSLSPVQQLTDREVEVLQFLGDGLTTRQIATRLGLSPKTIDRYRDNIKHKLQLKNATELIRYATQWALENR
jgi:DNA-binding NarL/FixJ family response regulator